MPMLNKLAEHRYKVSVCSLLTVKKYLMSKLCSSSRLYCCEWNFLYNLLEMKTSCSIDCLWRFQIVAINFELRNLIGSSCQSRHTAKSPESSRCTTPWGTCPRTQSTSCMWSLSTTSAGGRPARPPSSPPAKPVSPNIPTWFVSLFFLFQAFPLDIQNTVFNNKLTLINK